MKNNKATNDQATAEVTKEGSSNHPIDMTLS